jgi:hypothetical protein
MAAPAVTGQDLATAVTADLPVSLRGASEGAGLLLLDELTTAPVLRAAGLVSGVMTTRRARVLAGGEP